MDIRSAAAESDAQRTRLSADIDKLLSSAQDGRLPHTRETHNIDFKEEAGRRNGSRIEPGQHKNTEAATKLADEVACMVNSPGGGALLLGIEHGTGLVIGTKLDVDWLRQEIYNRIDVAPDIVEKTVEGQRILVIFVAAAPEPVEDTSDRIR